jgi:hypothetical protein
MNKFKYGVTGKERKALATAIADFLNTVSKYLRAPGYEFQIGSYIVDRDGTLHGEYNAELLEELVT